MENKRVAISQNLKKAASETKKLREAKIILAIGERGVGKTHETMRFFNEEYCITTPIKHGRKVLIYDTNGEFENVDPLSFYDVSKFNIQKKIEIRRILARDPDTFKPLGVTDKYKLLEALLQEENSPRAMALLLEDLNSYTTGTTSVSMVNVLTTNRHRELDIFIHLQTFRAVPPRIWGNINIMRLHGTGDDVTQVFNKVRNPRLTHVANILVQEKTKTDKRFFCFVDYDENTISGKFTYNEIFDACHMFYLYNKSERNRFSVLRQKQKITEKQFIDNLVKEFTKKSV
jgi:hypothetical protein